MNYSGAKKSFNKIWSARGSQRGSLFLKELASLNPGGQAKLVKALEDGVFFRCGGSEPLVFNTRIIASSRTPLEPLLENGKFRDDLYYLLNVAPILYRRLEQELTN